MSFCLKPEVALAQTQRQPHKEKIYRESEASDGFHGVPLLRTMRYAVVSLLSMCLYVTTSRTGAQEPTEKSNPTSMLPAILEVPALPAPDSVDFQELRSYMETQSWDKAKGVAERLVSRQPQTPSFHFCLGYVLLRQHHNIPAIRSLRRAEALGCEDPALPKTLGLAYYAINQFVLFKQQMQKGIKAAADDPWPHYYLGLYEATVTENFTAALDHFDEAVALRRDDVKMIYYRGFCHEMLNQRGLAQKDYEEAIRILNSSKDSFSLPHQGMARMLAPTDKEAALHHAELAVQQDAGLAENHSILAKIYEQMGRIPEAIRQLKAATEADSTLAAPHYQLYKLLTRQGEKNEASRELAEFQKLKMLYGS